MSRRPRIGLVVLGTALVAGFAVPASAPPPGPSHFAELRWRGIGPYRGGRTRATAGVPSRPSVFYIGPVNGGVFKTTDYGRTWQPVFDDQPTGSIGAIAVAPSDPNVVYVGSGEGLQRPDLSTGDGIYKSTDAGKTWEHLGLRDSQQVPRLAVDPRDPNRLFAAALGHPYGPSEERGIFRSTDGGRTFLKVLYKDENTGGFDVEIDPSNPAVVYATLWESRQAPWENGAWDGPGGGLFKSTDGGATWRPLTQGLPPVVQAAVAIAPAEPRRLYAAVTGADGTGIYRSDDAGESWARATKDTRPATRIGGGDLPALAVDPRNPDVVYSASIVLWKSSDGGKSWTALRGAPGGDDYQEIWINPNDGNIMLVASDQGAVITVNGGETWSSWYNQPTAQLYHVAADNAFPYRVCSGQQESGSACVLSRGGDGQITLREWHPVGVDEYGYAAPDPLDPDVVYGGKVTRYDRRTGQVQNVSPKPLRGADYRVLRTQPVVFSPLDPRVLYFAANSLWKTRDGGRGWEEISPDLTRKEWEVPASVGKYRDDPAAKPSRRGVIYAVAPSPRDPGRIWAGTDDGLVHVTEDGGAHWRDVTPPMLSPWSKVSALEAGHFDPATCYAAINAFRLDDLRPHILRTHDGGKTWTEIASGIPDGGAVNVVREDPKRKGLLFAGTEREVYVSFEDGASWLPLRLNMPATSIRDLTVKGDDLIAATHGRGFFILDDITPLRQLDGTVAASKAFLFEPQEALRIRWSTNTDTPVPPDEPAGQNPPNGAIIDYYLGPDVAGAVTLEVLDDAGRTVRRFSSEDPADPVDPMLAIPSYWLRPPRPLSNAPGMHRFVWDLHYPPAPRARVSYPMAAVPRATAPSFSSPWAMPGAYTVKLTANGTAYSRRLTVSMDPRVKTPRADLLEQFTFSMRLYEDVIRGASALDQLRALRAQLKKAAENAGEGAAAIAALDKKADALEGATGGGFGGGGGRGASPAGPDTINGVRGSLSSLMNLLQGADAAPTRQAAAAVIDREKAWAGVMARWEEMRTRELPELNVQLRKAGVAELALQATNP